MRYCYLDKELAKKGIACCYTTMLDERIEDYIEQFGENTVEFEGEDLPHYITLDEATGKVRAATVQELYERGEYLLNEDEYLKEGIVKEVPPIPSGIIKGEFDEEKEEWIETATKDDILDYYKQQIIETVREIGVREAAGFYDSNLAHQLEELKKKHLDLSHEIANEMNLRY